MPEQVIICPRCKSEIPLTEAISQPMREQIQREFQEESARKIEEAEKELKKKMEEGFVLERTALLQELDEKSQKLKSAQAQELELRRKARELEEKAASIELDVARRMDEERKAIEDKVSLRFMEDHMLKDREKEKLISDMKQQIEDLKRKADQGSQQIQGEVLELTLEDLLKANFPFDIIDPINKGKKGGDVIHQVRTASGQSCGTIYWESKNTKLWSNDWIAKLKDDQRAANAEIGVILSIALPKDIITFGFKEGVWITNYASLLGLANVLRWNLVQVAGLKLASEGRDDKKEELYNYLCSPRFTQRVEAIVEAFKAMNKDLIDERAAVERMWAKRENQLMKALKNMVQFYTDMQEISGVSLPQIRKLELKELAEGSEPDSQGEAGLD